MKQILFIGQFPPPIHGVSIINTYIAEHKIIKKDFNIKLIDLKFGKSIKDLKKFSVLKVIQAIYYSFFILISMIRKNYDIVYFTITPTGFGFYRDALYLVILKLFKSKILIHLHGKGIHDNQKNSIKRILYRWVFKKTYVICLSDRLAKDIRNVYKERPFIVPNGIAVNKLKRKNENHGNNSVPKILFVSNLIRNKGVFILIQALVILKSKGYKFKVRFVGSPGDVTIEMLESTLKNEKLDGVATVVGPLFGEDKFREYENADLFVFPTYNDVFGLVNLEAMQYSLPVVSTFEGSIPDVVIDNETGLLVEKENAVMLSEKIGILLGDKELRIRMGANGYNRFMENYTLDRLGNNMSETFHNVLNSGKNY